MGSSNGANGSSGSGSDHSRLGDDVLRVQNTPSNEGESPINRRVLMAVLDLDRQVDLNRAIASGERNESSTPSSTPSSSIPYTSYETFSDSDEEEFTPPSVYDVSYEASDEEGPCDPSRIHYISYETFLMHAYGIRLPTYEESNREASTAPPPSYEQSNRDYEIVPPDHEQVNQHSSSSSSTVEGRTEDSSEPPQDER